MDNILSKIEHKQHLIVYPVPEAFIVNLTHLINILKFCHVLQASTVPDQFSIQLWPSIIARLDFTVLKVQMYLYHAKSDITAQQFNYTNRLDNAQLDISVF
jgi:hypothetical protein